MRWCNVWARIIVPDRHSLLSNYWSGIHARIDEMDGAAGDLNAVIQRLFPGLQAGKGRQQGGVDIDDPAFKSLEEVPLEHSHEARQGDHIHLGFPQGARIGVLGLLVELGAEAARGQVLRPEAALARVAEDPGVRHVAEDYRDLGRNQPGEAGVSDGGEVGALAGTQDPNPEWWLSSHVS